MVNYNYHCVPIWQSRFQCVPCRDERRSYCVGVPGSSHKLGLDVERYRRGERPTQELL